MLKKVNNTIFMYFRNYKKCFKLKCKSKNSSKLLKNSMYINKFLFNKLLHTSKGLFCRIIAVRYFMLGLKGGDYAYTRKLYNFIIFKNKRRR